MIGFYKRNGFYLSPSDLTKQFQDVWARMPAGVGDPVALSLDFSPNKNDFIQPTDAERLVLESARGAICFRSSTNQWMRAQFSITQPWTRISLIEVLDWSVYFQGNSNINSGYLGSVGNDRLTIRSGTNGQDTYVRLIRRYPVLMTEIHDGAKSSLAINFDPPTVADAGTFAPNGCTILGNHLGQGDAGRVYGVIEVEGRLSEAEIDDARRSLIADAGFSHVIVAEGDSIIDGGEESYFSQYAASEPVGAMLIKNAIGGSRLATNQAIGAPPGLLVSGCYAGDLIYRTGLSDDVVAQKLPGVKYTFHCGIGTNDNVAEVDSDAWISTWVNYLLARRAAGFDNIVVTTLIPRSDNGYAQFNARRAVLNPKIRNAAASNNFYLCDFAADPVMGVDGAELDLSLYVLSGGPHPTQYGHSVLADIFETVIESV